MARVAKALIPVASALLLFLAFLGPWLWWVVFFALAPLFAELRERRGWTAFRAGYAFGFAYMLCQFSWLVPLVARWVGNPWLAAIPMLVGSFLAGFWFGWAGFLVSKAFEYERPWLAPLVWAGVELVRSLCPVLAYPWGLVGTPLNSRPELMQLAWFGSVFLVSAWVCIPNLLLALMLTKIRKSELGYSLLAFGLLLAISLVRYFWPTGGQSILAAAGQPGVDLAFHSSDEAHSLHNFNIETLIRDSANRKVDILVLPEGSNLNPKDPEHPSFELNRDLATVYGSHRKEGEKTYQSAFLAEHGAVRHADKTRLVIFGEFVPGRDYLPFLQAFNLPDADVDAGQTQALLPTFNTKRLVIGPLVCFEGIFPDLAYRQAVQGANILAVLSIDNWFTDTFAMEQLLSGTAYRAVESGLPTVRAAQLGYTAIFDQRGRALAKAPMKQLATANAEVKVGGGGPFPLFLAFPFLSVASCFWVLRKPRSNV